jgi:chromate transporter
LKVPLTEALWFWTKLGFISFGGPAGQIAVLHTELVEKRRWISERRFLHALNYCMLLPGPEAQQLVTYIGWLMHRSIGGILAGVLFVLPSLLILIGLGWVYLTFGQTPWISALFFGIKPAVTAIVLCAALKIGKRAITHRALWLITALSFIAIFIFNVPFPVIVICAALIGVWGGKKYPSIFSPKARTVDTVSSQGNSDAIIGDSTPTPEHAIFSIRSTVQKGIVGTLLWTLPIAALILFFGWKALYPQLAWFFTKAALLTFGGAYAVLPYVYQGAVEHYQWVTASQMIDGLALGEATPGPLIMVLAFVAYIAGHVQEALGPDLAFWSGAVAACIATWFTFLPSFLFILIGGPLIESTHGKLGFTAPLTAITAAVVGVIVNLGLFFAYHVFFPTGFTGSVSVPSVLICAAAAIALIRFQLGIMTVLAGAALTGLFLGWLG